MSSPLSHEVFHFPAGTGLPQGGTLATGLPELDRLLRGGLPRGKLVEVTGGISSGKTSLIGSILRQAAAAGECTAYVDAFDTLDPESLCKAGVEPGALLWVRCRAAGSGPEAAVDRALKAADILAQAGGFAVVVMDLEPVAYRHAPPSLRIPTHLWFRLQRAVKGSSTVLLVLSREKLSGTAAAVVLALERQRVYWGPPGAAYRFEDHTPVVPGGWKGTRFQGVESQARLLKGEFHGCVSVHSRF